MTGTKWQKFVDSLPLYVAILIGILCTWVVSTLGKDPRFVALTNQGSDVALTILIVGWLGLCSAHFAATGDPAPVQPAVQAATVATLDRVAGILEKLTPILDRFDQPPAPPTIPENTPKLVFTPTENP